MNQLKFLPVGQEDFGEIIENNGYYVDKTLLIRKLLEVRSKVTLFTRPRRFGKTLNISMLQYFFEQTKTSRKELFEHLAIGKETELCEKYMGQYPVIHLSLKSGKQKSFEYAMTAIKQEIAAEFRRHEKPVRAYGFEKERIEKILNAEGEETDYLTSLQFLSQILFQYYNKKVIVLLDEYDVPLENAYFNGFYDKMISFLRSLFESVLKTNPCLEFAVLTGCLRISKESIFTGLNNLRIISILDKAYEEYFGFTTEEIKDLLAYYGLSDKFPIVKEWYDGYLFGEQEVYNPWSVLSYLSDLLENADAVPKSYWSNTSSNSIIRNLIENASLQTKNDIEQLIAGESISSRIHEDITYADIETSEENLWNFLYFTGYLKKVDEYFNGEQQYMNLKVPNVEINYIYKNKVREWMAERIQKDNMDSLYRGLLSGNEKIIEEELGRQLRESISFLDGKESFYHGFLLGLLKPMRDYIIKSNREAGDGRPDIVLTSPDIQQPAVLLELKYAKTFQELERKAEEGIKQIQEREYDRELKSEGYETIICYGISFFKKNCKVKTASFHLPE